MPFSIMQESLESPPTTEQLAQAFAGVPGLTRQDGALQAKDAFGTLASGLSREQASALEKALRAGGVPVVGVAEETLPALPPPKVLTRADLLPEALVLYDVLGRPQRASWSEVVLIAAGSVLMSRYKRTYETTTIGDPEGYGFLVQELKVVENRRPDLLVEMLLNGHPNRYRISSKQFIFAYLGAEASLRSTDNFLRLFRDLVRFAPAASRNRGAEFLAADPPRLMAYPSRHAFEEECVWWLWRRSLPAQS